MSVKQAQEALHFDSPPYLRPEYPELAVGVELAIFHRTHEQFWVLDTRATIEELSAPAGTPEYVEELFALAREKAFPIRRHPPLPKVPWEAWALRITGFSVSGNGIMAEVVVRI